MPLQTETGNKKHIVAERYFDSGFSESLCKLFITDFPDFRVLSVYSELGNKFLAYKLLNRSISENDIWLESNFSLIQHVDLNTDFELVPIQFAEINIVPPDLKTGYAILPPSGAGYRHYAYGLEKFNIERTSQLSVYVFKHESKYNIIIFEGKACKFSNSFEIRSENELLYFILSVLVSLSYKQEETNIYLDYNIIKNTGIKEFIRPYFRSVMHMLPDFDNPDPEIQYLHELLFPNHLLSLCV